MISNVLTAIAVVGIYQVPQQQPDPIPIPPPVTEIEISSVPLPWGLPVLPPVIIDLDLSEPVYNDVEHTDDYAGNLTTIEETVGVSSDIQADAESEIDTWLGPGSILPDLSSGADFATGIDLPGYVNITAYDMANEMGTNLGTLFANIRALATLNIDVGGITYVIGFCILCIAWMMLFTMIKFGIQFVDMCWSVIVRVIELIPFVE